jgi:hypothetical protein
VVNQVDDIDCPFWGWVCRDLSYFRPSSFGNAINLLDLLPTAQGCILLVGGGPEAVLACGLVGGGIGFVNLGYTEYQILTSGCGIESIALATAANAANGAADTISSNPGAAFILEAGTTVVVGEETNC